MALPMSAPSVRRESHWMPRKGGSAGSGGGENMAAPTLSGKLYSLLFRRTSTFALTIAVGALFFERAFDQGADAIYEHLNQGKLWKHIKHKYEN